MKRITLINRISTAIAKTDCSDDNLLNAYLIDVGQFQKITGVYSGTTITVSIPYTDKDGELRFELLNLDVKVRIKGGHNYKYAVKFYVGESDPFEGYADECSRSGRAKWEFLNELRAACDWLTPKGGIAAFKL